MSFGSNKGYRSDKPFEDYKKFVTNVLNNDYGIVCIKKCFQNFDQPLVKEEEICLAKCFDRSYDYLMETESDFNPYDKRNSKHYLNSSLVFDSQPEPSNK